MSAGRFIRKRPVVQSISEDETIENPSRSTNDPLEHCTSSTLLSESSTLSTSGYEHLSSVSLKSLYDWCVYHTFLFSFHFPKKRRKRSQEKRIFLDQIFQQYELLFCWNGSLKIFLYYKVLFCVVWHTYCES